MKILLVGLNYYPERIGIGKYTSEMAQWLLSRGHEVRVICSPPYYPQWKVEPSYKTWKYRIERSQGILIMRCPLWVPHRLSAFCRILHLFSFALSSLPIILWQGMRWRPNVVLVIQPPLFCAPAAWLASRLAGGRSWLHIQDDELGAAFELGLLKGRWLRTALEALELTLVRRFDRVSSISTIMVDRLEKRRVPADKRVLLANWVDTQVIFPMRDHGDIRKELHFSEQDFVALYSGNMGRKQGLEIVLEAAAALTSESRIHFVLCGDGALRKTLMDKAVDLPNISFLPLQPPERLNVLLNLADVHLLIQNGQGSDAFLPSKLTGMLASGRPIVATVSANSSVAQIINQAGIAVQPGNAQALKDAVLELSSDVGRRHRMAETARRIAVANFEKSNTLSAFEAQLHRLVDLNGHSNNN